MDSNHSQEPGPKQRNGDAGWERDTINRLAFAALNE